MTPVFEEYFLHFFVGYPSQKYWPQVLEQVNLLGNIALPAPLAGIVWNHSNIYSF